MNLFLNCDCMDQEKGMLSYPDKYFDLAIVDPEYGIGSSHKSKYHQGAFTEYNPKNWDDKTPDEKYFNELFRVSQNQIIWGANYFVKFLPAVKNWIVWDKLQPEGISLSMHELAFYSGDGQAKIFRGYNGANRCVIPELAKQYIRIHPTQKPIALYKWLIKNYAKEGWKILDTHVGSASSLIAFEEFGLEYVGFEIDSDYYKGACERLEKYRSQLRLFKNTFES